MRKQILFLSTCIFFIASSSLLLSRQHNGGLGSFMLEQKSADGKSGLSKAQTAADAAQWRFDRLKDENGNLYPSYYANAIKRAEQLRQTGARSGLGLQWEELGPDNVGGRTRAILVDKRDPSNQTIYAGGVSGGMWKSTDGANTWTRLTNWNQWLSIACIAQGPAPDYTIYIGTGEGLSGSIGGTSMNSGSMGNGIYKLNSNDAPVLLTPDITTNNTLNLNSPWAAVNRIAVNPLDATQILAATLTGLYESIDGGSTWGPVQLPSNLHSIQTQEANDVKWSKNGVNVYASVGGPFGGILLESLNGGYTWGRVTTGSNPGFPNGSLGRIEMALAPSNDSILYLSIATTSGCTNSVYRSADAGGTWAIIGAKGPSFDPMTTECQGFYDNTIAVNPLNPNKIYNAGVNFYTWSNETGWSLADAGLQPLGGSGDVNPNYIHPDKHAIVFADNDSNVMYVGCDGGIYKSIDAGSSFPFPNYSVKNRGYNVTQNYGIAAAITGEVMGGSQDNGTNYINYLGNTPMAAQEVIGGDGIFTAISHIDPRFYFGGVYYADVERDGAGATIGGFSTFYDIKADPQGQGSTSACGASAAAGNAPFITPFHLGETKTAANGLKTVPFVADRNYNNGDVVTIQSDIAKYPFQVTLSAQLDSLDTLPVVDPVRSRMFVTSNCGVWLTSDALNLGIIPRWFKLANSITGIAESYANSTDADVLYIGTSAGYVYRFANLNAKCDTTKYPSGGTAKAIYTASNQYSYKIVANGRSIEGIAVDPNDNNHIVATVAGFSSTNQPHVYESHNGGTSWVADTTGLPNMPVYSVVIHDSTTFIIGTELGVWGWDGSKWTEENGGMQRVPVFRIIEKPLYTDGCKVLYIGTHGRGMWRSVTLTPSDCQTQVATGVADIKNTGISDLNIFPNPVHSSSHVSITLDNKADVTLRIFDMMGKIYKENTYRNTTSGENLFALDASGLSSGTYLLAATVGGVRTKSRLFVVAK